ncbi:hypothetical protein RND81_11G199000 [Saponaria officinalis]|uniref:Uncharacterized protein n=1 Tax=Saponaria officinalis TaxID=3572 RepID=A0AAW1HPF6_SAPOF
MSLFKNVKDWRKHVADYCFLDDGDLLKEEALVEYGTNATLQREDLLTMLPSRLTSSAVIDCWAMLLNMIESEENKNQMMAFFGLRHTVGPFLLCLLPVHGENGQEGHDAETDALDEVVPRSCKSDDNSDFLSVSKAKSVISREMVSCRIYVGNVDVGFAIELVNFELIILVGFLIMCVR